MAPSTRKKAGAGASTPAVHAERPTPEWLAHHELAEFDDPKEGIRRGSRRRTQVDRLADANEIDRDGYTAAQRYERDNAIHERTHIGAGGLGSGDGEWAWLAAGERLAKAQAAVATALGRDAGMVAAFLSELVAADPTWWSLAVRFRLGTKTNPTRARRFAADAIAALAEHYFGPKKSARGVVHPALTDAAPLAIDLSESLEPDAS